LKDLARVQAKGEILLAMGGRNYFLRKHAAGHKSGRLPLIMFDLTIRRSNEDFTIRRAESAVLRNIAKASFGKVFSRFWIVTWKARGFRKLLLF